MRFRRLFRLIGREPSVAEDIGAEIAGHLEQVTEWLVGQGWKPDAAREEAIRRFGDVESFQRELGAIDRGAGRLRRRSERFASLRQDLVVAWRGLRRAPGYAAVIIGTLGLALGANATMFGVVDRLLLSPPPGFVAPELVSRVDAARWIDGRIGEAWESISYPSFEGLRSRGEEFSHVAAFTSRQLSYGLGREARPVRAVLATGQYFGLIGVAPVLGRLFGEDDDAPPAGRAVIVLSHAFWRDAFGADRGILGRSLLLNGSPFEVIGVAPPRFTGSELSPVDLWVPFSAYAPLFGGGGGDDWRTARGRQWLVALMRRQPDVPVERAETSATLGYQAANVDFGEFEARAEVRFRRLEAYTAGGGSERVAAWLYGVTIVVLLIACANIANLVLARGIVRRGETAVRRALGISRGRLLRQHLAETLLVVGLGLGVGLGIARTAGGLVRRLLLDGTAFEGAPVDLRVLAATATAAVLAALLASLWPLIQSGRVDPAAELHGAGRSTGKLGARARNGLLLVQTTLATALVVMAGLFLRSIDQVRSLDLGIEPQGITLASVNLRGVAAGDDEISAIYERTVERVRRLPGVTAAGVTLAAPFLSNMGGRIRVPGLDSIPRLPGGGPYYFDVGPGTLEAYGVRLLEGRRFTEADREGSAPVVVVGARMATTLWPGQSAIGKCIIVGADSMPCREVVGVVADLHRQELEEPPFFMYFRVLAQDPERPAPQMLVIRAAAGTAGLPEAIRAAFTAERGDLPFVRLQNYGEIIGAQARPWRLGASLLTIFGGLSLVIAAIGLYGVIGFGISQRTRELGLRSALGASPRQLIHTVLSAGLVTAVVGVALGLGLAFVAAPRLETMLFRTSPTDPLVLGAAALLVVTGSLAAAWLPGRRALRIDPVGALRSE